MVVMYIFLLSLGSPLTQWRDDWSSLYVITTVVAAADTVVSFSCSQVGTELNQSVPLLILALRSSGFLRRIESRAILVPPLKCRNRYQNPSVTVCGWRRGQRNNQSLWLAS